MHIVYQIKFPNREKENNYPFLYIGSKSNAIVENNKMYHRNKEYWGSSRHPQYKNCLLEETPIMTIISQHSSYEEALEAERNIQIELDVVADPKYFNLSIATINSYSDPEYATFKHLKTGKIARLPRNHISVVSGDWVGVTKGRKLSDSEKKAKSQPGTKNPFFGKKHTEESIQKIKEGQQRFFASDSGIIEKKRRAKTAKTTFSGKPKTSEHKKKIGKKNMIMLKNKNTGECVRIHKDELFLYDRDIWKAPHTLADYPIGICPWCGKENKMVSSFKKWHFNNCKYYENNEN